MKGHRQSGGILMERTCRKTGYLISSAIAVLLLFLQTPAQRYFSYLSATTYTLTWVWAGIALVAILAVAAGLSLLWSQGLSHNFRIPAEAVKAALALVAFGVEFFYYRVPSLATVFCVTLFLTGFVFNLFRTKA